MTRMTMLLAVLIGSLLSPVFANTKISQMQTLAASEEYNKLKSSYEQCVLSKGMLYIKITQPGDAIHFSQLACKRQLLAIKQFLLASAFKTEIIEALLASVKEGVEIDLVNMVFEDKLKQAGIATK